MDRGQPRHAATRARKAFRPDIQGLRAFAVLAVVLDHLFGWPEGGFIGVDVFFVVSGFLITGLLLREYERTGHISFVDFYRKRIRRIMPAAVVVLVFTVTTAYFVFGQARFLSTVVDAIGPCSSPPTGGSPPSARTTSRPAGRSPRCSTTGRSASRSSSTSCGRG